MDTVVRVAYVYLLLMVALRVVGKRELGQLSPFDLVTLLLIPEIFSPALTRGDFSMTTATIGVATLLTLVFLTAILTFRFPALERAVSGEPSVLVRNGTFIERQMRREHVTPEDIFAEMHKSGLHELRQVRWAILEVDGKISVIPAEAGSGVARPEEKRGVSGA